jgi:hypothetical protein
VEDNEEGHRQPTLNFTVIAAKISVDDIYIQSAVLNGIDYDCAFLPHHVIMQGGLLVSESV